jgi:hypothetical protein
MTFVVREAVECCSRDRDAARGRLIDARDHVEKRCLAAAGAPDDADELALSDGKIDPAQRGNAARGAFVGLADALQGNHV